MIPSRIGTKGITVPLENQQNYWVLTLDVNLVSVPHLGERVAYDITEYPDALEWVKTKLALGEIEGDA
jgi:hypothetical protein